MITTILPMTPNVSPDATPDELWAEIHRLCELVNGPKGFATWYDAALAERLVRVQLESELAQVRAGNFPLWEYRVHKNGEWSPWQDVASLANQMHSPAQCLINIRTLMLAGHKYNLRIKRD